MKIDTDVMVVMSTLKFSGNQAVIESQLDRKMYVKVNKVLDALGGAWNRKAKAHVFPSDAQARVDMAILAGEVTTKQDEGFFETPKDVVDILVEAAEIEPGHLVLEPSAGVGAIVRGVLVAEPGAMVEVVERNDERRAALLKEFGDSIRIHQTDDCMLLVVQHQYDRVIMNPPFLRSGIGDHISHVRYAFSMLRSGGRLVSVMPSGVTFREDTKHREFRSWVNSMGHIQDLPHRAFRASGTNVNTCYVVMNRP